MGFRLVRCDAEGRPQEPLALSAPLVAHCAASAALYARLGYAAPWVSYVAVDGALAVGGGAFVGAPVDGVVEIAYFTLPEHEGRGHARATARGLVEIARATLPTVVLKAFTLPERNASTAILTKLGFRQVGIAQDPDAGTVWEWRSP